MATKWGILSAGFISNDFVKALSTLDPDDHDVVAVAARSQDKAEEFAKSYDIPKAYGSYQELANDPDVEVVYIGAIHPAHLDLCKMMMNAGKHVLCEKPLAMNVKETKEILEVAREKKVFLMEAMWSRCQPSMRQVSSEIENGNLGEVYQCTSTFGAPIDVPRMNEKKLGGGTMLDIGIYTLWFSQLVFKGERPEKIIAAGHLNKGGVDESISVILLYKNNCTATFSAHSKMWMSNEGEVFGTKGKLKIHFPFWCSEKVTTPSGDRFFPHNKSKYQFKFINSAGLAHEAQHVRECLQQGLLESPLVSLDETLMAAEIMEEIRKQVGVHYPQDK